ncbi:MAG: DUF6781 family protein [Phycisphaerales bacterium]
MPTPHETASAVENRSEVRVRIRELAARTIAGSKTGLRQLTTVANDVMGGVTDAVKDAMPNERHSVLKQVVSGLSDAYAAAANTTKATFEDARKRGQRLAHGPVKQTVRDLQGLEENFFETVKSFADHVGDDAKHEWHSVVNHAKAAAKEIRPAAKSALEAANGHLGELATQAASTGVKATGTIVGGLLSAAGNQLRGAGKTMQAKSAKKKAKKKKAAAKKPTAKKPAAKKAKARKKTGKKR